MPETSNNRDHPTPSPTKEELAFLVDALVEKASDDHFDEIRDTQGQLRPIWEKFLSILGTDPIKHLADYVQTISRILSQNGVTYNVYDANQAKSRPWSLNPLPLLIEAPEWQKISQGIAQRAKLLNQILQDIYGPQSLLHEGLLPGALVKGHPGYLRPLDQVSPPGGIYLHIAAFDIARGPNGQWWVVSNRTQAPSGLGYVLENRLIISRMFPEAFRNMRIQHIASSYRRLLNTLTDLAKPLAHGEPLRFALLTPGPYNETYFEHAYLSRYLGLPLVEGADLMVRDDMVYLKTLHGLQRIHGLLRRVDDEFMDPLELRADSTLGVPGLLQAVRANKVLIANALGTGFVESPAIQGFLPAIAEKLLGETLLLPSLHTWWCGEETAHQAIAPLLHTQVIKPTFLGADLTRFQPVIGANLADEELKQLQEQIKIRPELYTTQTYLPFSQALTWHNNRLSPKTAMLRVYAIANAQGEWEILPGGMTRIASEDPHIVSISKGGSTLDTWIETDGEVDTFSMLAQRPQNNAILPSEIRSQLVSSRTAENLYWLGRYTERAEYLTRLAKESLVVASMSGDDHLQELQAAITDLTVRNGLVPEEVPSLGKSPKVFARTLIATLASPSSYSVGFYLNAIDNNLRLVRDRLPSDHLRLSNGMKVALSRLSNQHLTTEDRSLLTAIETLDDLGLQLAALTGLQVDRMTRDLGWRMLTIGRLLERLIILSETLHTFFVCDADLSDRGFEMLLSLFDSAITYRSRYQGQQDINTLNELLIFDISNPRSIGCILQELISEIAHLPYASEKLNQISKRLTDLQPDEEHTLDVVTYCQNLVDEGRRTSDQLSSHYFAHVQTRRTTS